MTDDQSHAPRPRAGLAFQTARNLLVKFHHGSFAVSNTHGLVSAPIDQTLLLGHTPRSDQLLADQQH